MHNKTLIRRLCLGRHTLGVKTQSSRMRPAPIRSIGMAWGRFARLGRNSPPRNTPEVRRLGRIGGKRVDFASFPAGSTDFRPFGACL